MKRTGFGIGALIVLWAFLNSSEGCPHCNIHNYFASSVRSSANIFLAKVIAQVDEHTAEVEVARVIRGSRKPGDVVKMTMYEANQYVGQKMIFSDPTSSPPTFEVLPLRYEEEVAFLATAPQPDPNNAPKFGMVLNEAAVEKEEEAFRERLIRAIGSVEVAIRRLQDVSNESRAAAMAFLKAQKTYPAKEIMAAIEAVRPSALSPDANTIGSDLYGLECLVQALLRVENDEVEGFILRQVQAILTQAPGKVNWSEVPYHPTISGFFLEAIIGSTKGDWDPAYCADFRGGQHDPRAKLLEKEKKAVLDALPKLEGFALADAVYALCSRGVASAEEVAKLIKNDDSRDFLALGLHWVAWKRAGVWDHEGALAAWQKAESLATRKELKEKISVGIAQTTERLPKKKE